MREAGRRIRSRLSTRWQFRPYRTPEKCWTKVGVAMCYQFEFDGHCDCSDEWVSSRSAALMCAKRRSLHDRRLTCSECRQDEARLTATESEIFDKAHCDELPTSVR